MVKKILLTLLLIFVFVFSLPKDSLATPKGYVNCGTYARGTLNCQCTSQVTCAEGGNCQCTCGENCPSGGGGGGCPDYTDCGAQTCDLCTQVCCISGCRSIAEGCAPPPPSCDENAWGACSVSCGGGVEYNDCGTPRACNTQACCDPNVWSACGGTCGSGVQYNNCGTARACDLPCESWWQVIDGDVKTNGDIISHVPLGLYFELPGTGGFPGVPMYGDGTNLTSAKASAKGWLAASPYVIVNNKVFDYEAFAKKVPADTVINPVPAIGDGRVSGNFFKNEGDPSYGYRWFKYDATQFHLPLHITSTMNLGERKVILFVDGADVYLEGDVKVDEGKGFFMLLTNKNIKIDPKVTDLYGVYLADEGIYTGVGDKPLHIKGAVATWGEMNLQRDLGQKDNADTPAEVFEYDPNLFFLYPHKLSIFKMRWKEVGPQ